MDGVPYCETAPEGRSPLVVQGSPEAHPYGSEEVETSADPSRRAILLLEDEQLLKTRTSEDLHQGENRRPVPPTRAAVWI